MKIGTMLLICFFLMTSNIYSQVLTGSKTKVIYTEKYGVKFIEIKTRLKNNSTKTVTKVYITVVFKDKRYDNPYDMTAPIKTDTDELAISILPGWEAEAVFSVLEPSDINWVYNLAKIERVIYSDGSVANL